MIGSRVSAWIAIAMLGAPGPALAEASADLGTVQSADSPALRHALLLVRTTRCLAGNSGESEPQWLGLRLQFGAFDVTADSLALVAQLRQRGVASEVWLSPRDSYRGQDNERKVVVSAESFSSSAAAHARVRALRRRGVHAFARRIRIPTEDLPRS